MVKMVPEMTLCVVRTARKSAGFTENRYVDIVGVTGSIPVTPTIRLPEIVEEFSSAPAGHEACGRFNEPRAAVFARSPHL